MLWPVLDAIIAENMSASAPNDSQPTTTNL